MGNIVAIVGRPNVGKSTLFNRLIGERQAIIDDESGVTRDRQYGTSEWNGKKFTVIDTGGFVTSSDDIFEQAIKSQVEIAIAEAAVIVFMVDVATGITDLDDDVANMLRKSEKEVILVVNKVDNNQRLLEANEFWSIGIEETYFISSVTGSGTGDMLDAITDKIIDVEPIDSKLPKFAIIGQPNVGKSSLVNVLLGEDRNIVTDIAGTTRDSIHSHYNKFDKEFLLIDTAGIRRKTKVYEDLEFYSVMRAIKAMDEADVILLMIEANSGLEAQDMSLFRLAIKRNKGVVLLVNKWDLESKESNTMRDKEKELKHRLAPFNDIPILFISVLEKQRVFKAVEAAFQVFENRNKKLKTSELNKVMLAAIEKFPPPNHKGHFAKIKYVTQLPTYYPAFAFFCNNPKYIKENYKHYLENQLRKNYDFSGVPIGLFFRKKS